MEKKHRSHATAVHNHPNHLRTWFWIIWNRADIVRLDTDLGMITISNDRVSREEPFMHNASPDLRFSWWTCNQLNRWKEKFMKQNVHFTVSVPPRVERTAMCSGTTEEETEESAGPGEDTQYSLIWIAGRRCLPQPPVCEVPPNLHQSLQRLWPEVLQQASHPRLISRQPSSAAQPVNMPNLHHYCGVLCWNEHAECSEAHMKLFKYW